MALEDGGEGLFGKEIGLNESTFLGNRRLLVLLNVVL